MWLVKGGRNWTSAWEANRSGVQHLLLEMTPKTWDLHGYKMTHDQAACGTSPGVEGVGWITPHGSTKRCHRCELALLKLYPTCKDCGEQKPGVGRICENCLNRGAQTLI